MKKVILGLSALCLVAFTSCKEDATKKVEEKNVEQAAVRDANSTKFPAITFDKAEHDFGEIEAKTAVETVFSYTNSGDAPLVITNIKSLVKNPQGQAVSNQLTAFQLMLN